MIVEYYFNVIYVVKYYVLATSLDDIKLICFTVHIFEKIYNGYYRKML